jgi:4-amino-4-deoxy-L-arabinose transferase-like glycosyltransferase
MWVDEKGWAGTVGRTQGAISASGRLNWARPRTERARTLSAWVATIALTTILRLPSLLYRGPVDDEAVYAVVARVILAGGLPYRDAIERKPPLLFYVYAAVFKIFGPDNWLALHIVSLVWVILTMFGLYVASRRLFDVKSGLIAALLYSLIQPWATAKNLAFNGEVLMNLPLAWAYAAAFAARADPGCARGRWTTAGALVAIAFLLKQPAAIAIVPLALYAVSSANARSNMHARGLRHSELFALATGFVIPIACATLFLWENGILSEAFYWTITAHTVPHVFGLHAIEHSALFVVVVLPLLLRLFDSRSIAVVWNAFPSERRAVVGWLIVSAIGAAAGGRFYPHYYIQIVPPLAAMMAPVFARARSELKHELPAWNSTAFAAPWLATAAGVSLCFQTFQVSHFRQASATAAYVSAHSSTRDRMFVWGQDTALYLDAGRLPASRYIATFPLTGYIFGEPLPGISTDDRIVPGAWENLATDLRNNPPRFIVDTQGAVRDPYPMAKYPFLRDLIATKYIRVFSRGGEVLYRIVT